MDTVSKEKRSQIMRSIKSTHTKPELIVRRLLFSLGYRYRLHVKHLPGKPDIVFSKKKKVIFVNGCFWHQHDSSDCNLARLPKSRLDFWEPKFKANVLRDTELIKQLADIGWSSLVIWECELKHIEHVKLKLLNYLI